MNRKNTEARKCMTAFRMPDCGLNYAAGSGGNVALAVPHGNSAKTDLSLTANNQLHDTERTQESQSLSASPKPEGGSIPDAELVKFFRVVGTATWKLEKRLFCNNPKEPSDERRRLRRHVEAIRDMLADIGVDIVDWTGKRYDKGMSLNAVCFEESSAVKEPTIAETLLPTIRCNRFPGQKQLQAGEVVVHIPVQTADRND